MVWRVRRTNVNTGAQEIAPASFVSGEEAFDAAWDNAGTFIKAAIRDNTQFGDVNNLRSDSRYKVWVERRPSRGLFIELRWDYPTGTPPNNPEGTWDTNSIIWEAVDI